MHLHGKKIKANYYYQIDNIDIDEEFDGHT